MRWARELSLAYGWTPRHIGELTLAQLFLYRGTAAGGRRRMTIEEAAAYIRK